MTVCHGPVGEVDDLALVVGREELVDRDGVELRQPLEPRHRDGPLPPLVGAEHGRLELLFGRGLDLLEAETLLLADEPKTLADAVDGFGPAAKEAIERTVHAPMDVALSQPNIPVITAAQEDAARAAKLNTVILPKQGFG